MALNIRNPEAERLTDELARLAGDLTRVRREKRRHSPAEDLGKIAAHYAEMPLLDHRTPDEILGYDEHGMPG